MEINLILEVPFTTSSSKPSPSLFNMLSLRLASQNASWRYTIEIYRTCPTYSQPKYLVLTSQDYFFLGI